MKMRISAPLILFALQISPFSVGMALGDSIAPTQPEVRHFVRDADMCLHLAGELSGENTLKQKRRIKQINKYCDSAKRQFIYLDKKYRADSTVQATLDQYRNELAD